MIKGTTKNKKPIQYKKNVKKRKKKKENMASS